MPLSPTTIADFDTLTVTVPNDTSLLGFQVMAQGVDLSPVGNGDICMPFAGFWGFTDIHTVTIGA